VLNRLLLKDRQTYQTGGLTSARTETQRTEFKFSVPERGDRDSEQVRQPNRPPSPNHDPSVEGHPTGRGGKRSVGCRVFDRELIGQPPTEFTLFNRA
jgi:hypothetical protein